MSKISDVLKSLGNEFATIADDGITAGDVSSFHDTGSYALNALVSGTIYGGFPSNKIVLCGAESSTGKTFFALSGAKGFQDKNPDGLVVIFESESAITKQMLVDRGLDTKRVLVVPVSTVEEFRTQCLKLVDNYLKKPEKERFPVFIILDSMGMLSTNKELGDMLEGSGTKDMTRAALLKAAWRAITLKIGQANISMFVTNHIYDAIGQGPYAAAKQGGGCLVAGSKIVMADGSTKNIEDVLVGDVVKTFGGESKVAETFVFDDKDVYEIEFEDGFKVQCSGDHKFLVGGEWVCARDLQDGQECQETT